MEMGSTKESVTVTYAKHVGISKMAAEIVKGSPEVMRHMITNNLSLFKTSDPVDGWTVAHSIAAQGTLSHLLVLEEFPGLLELSAKDGKTVKDMLGFCKKYGGRTCEVLLRRTSDKDKTVQGGKE